MSAQNSGKRWTTKDVELLRKLAAENTPTRIMALKLKRSEKAVYAKAATIQLSLRPNNQSPYGTKKKK